MDEWSFVVGTATTGQNLPLAEQPLAFRFYTGIYTSSAIFGEVSNSRWLWSEPQEPPVSPLVLYFNDPGLKMSSGAPIPASLRIRTDTNPPLVPEPTTALIIASGALMFAGRRRPRGGKGW